MIYHNAIPQRSYMGYYFYAYGIYQLFLNVELVSYLLSAQYYHPNKIKLS